LSAKEADFALREEELSPMMLAYRHGFVTAEGTAVSRSLEENASALGRLYHADRTDDLKLRFFTLKSTMKKGLLLAYIDGMVDPLLATQSVIEPLMMFAEERAVLSADVMRERIRRQFLPMMQTVEGTDFGAVVKVLNKGGGALFIEGSDTAFLLEMAGYPMRAVGKAQIEETVRGSQASFTESMRGNISQVRSLIRSENLVAEVVTVGRINRKECAILSVAGIVSPSLACEVKRRVEGVAVDHVFDCGALMRFLTEKGTQFPQMLTTERPDRTAEALMQGRVVILLDGDPFASIVPAVLWDFFHSTEDYEMRPPSVLFMRVLRYLGALVTMLLPGLYIALTYFHQEAIPTQLLVVIAGYRQMVPFPSLIEMLLLIVSFEFIREATLRVPSRLGGSISIVGAIILGQAAVTAKLVSPVLVVVVALTGLASYILPEYRFAFSLRVCQYAFLLAGALTGLVGISLLLVLLLIDLAGMASFGVPFLAPLIPRASGGYGEEDVRPDVLSPVRIVKAEDGGKRWQKGEANEEVR
ncbi:MAG: spore germination protein, partial [Selenomonadales bacterium]|nr:spore germination protein [Selenomonadales bacterium]